MGHMLLQQRNEIIFTVAAVIFTFTEGIHIIDSPFSLLAVMLLILGFILVMMGFLAELMLRIYYEGRRETPYTIGQVLENK